ncbi:MAG: dihydroorotate dehydrogenase electron transfer subunit [Bacilli bacterium]|nr:dihydroorotate dehydrogenase electron transfer subunit [Bacilli bacterium]
MRDLELKIVSNTKLHGDVYLLKMEAEDDLSSFIKPGQFAELELDGHFLRRPLSIADCEGRSVSFIYKTIGRGTKELTQYKAGKKLKTMLGLGNGFDLSKAKKPLFVAGGIGIAPFLYLGKAFNKMGIRPTLIIGFKNEKEVGGLELYKDYMDIIVTTDDGTYGEKGNPVSYLKSHEVDFDYYYACGPLVMLKFLSEAFNNGELSLEARMGCGFGACMGCSIMLKDGSSKRICREGPIFKAEELAL